MRVQCWESGTVHSDKEEVTRFPFPLSLDFLTSTSSSSIPRDDVPRFVDSSPIFTYAHVRQVRGVASEFGFWVILLSFLSFLSLPLSRLLVRFARFIFSFPEVF